MLPLLGPLAPLAGRFGIYIVIALGGFAAGLWTMDRWDDGVLSQFEIPIATALFANTTV